MSITFFNPSTIHHPAVAAAVVVVKVFPPDKAETINTVEQSKAVKPGLAVNAAPEELFEVALPYQFV